MVRIAPDSPTEVPKILFCHAGSDTIVWPKSVGRHSGVTRIFGKRDGFEHDEL